MSAADAEKKLAAEGLRGDVKVTVLECQDATIPEGQICNQVPAANQTTVSSVSVVLFVQAPLKREMPDVTDKAPDDAKKILAAYAVDVELKDMEHAPKSCHTDYVCDTTPKPGDPLPKGAHTTLWMVPATTQAPPPPKDPAKSQKPSTPSSSDDF
jgi:beta-lactam-binding protein with PASTA domain